MEGAPPESELAAAPPAADGGPPSGDAPANGEEPKRKRRRWSDAKVEEPAVQAPPPPPPPAAAAATLLSSLLKPVAPPSSGSSPSPDVLAATQAAAAEAVRKMNEQLGGGRVSAEMPASTSVTFQPGTSKYVLDIDINDCPNKAALTKKSTQEEIALAANVTILIRGRYKPPGDTSEERPIHLHLEGSSEEELAKAEEMIRAIMGPMPEAPPPPAGGGGGGMGLAPLGSAGGMMGGPPPPLPPSDRPFVDRTLPRVLPDELCERLEVGLDPAAGYQVRGGTACSS